MKSHWLHRTHWTKTFTKKKQIFYVSQCQAQGIPRSTKTRDSLTKKLDDLKKANEEMKNESKQKKWTRLNELMNVCYMKSLMQINPENDFWKMRDASDDLWSLMISLFKPLENLEKTFLENVRINPLIRRVYKSHLELLATQKDSCLIIRMSLGGKIYQWISLQNVRM